MASAGWTRSTADVREWLDAGAAMAGGGAAETALTDALAEAAGMFALPSHAGLRIALEMLRSGRWHCRPICLSETAIVLVPQLLDEQA